MRYLPDRPLPPSGYVPGSGARPSTPALPPGPRWPAMEWLLRDDYLWGVDLYNAGLYWEAHESWESAWRSVAEEPARQLLWGLIQCAAAALKADDSAARGKLLARALGHLSAAGAASLPMLGVPVARFIDAVTTWRDGGVMPQPLALTIRSCDRPGTLTGLACEPIGARVTVGAEFAAIRVPAYPAYESGQMLYAHQPPAAGDIDRLLARCPVELGEPPLMRLRVGWETDDDEDWSGANALGPDDDYERTVVMRADAAPLPSAAPPDVVLRPLESDADFSAAEVLSCSVYEPIYLAAYAPFIRWRYAEYRRSFGAGLGGALWGAFDRGNLVGAMALLASPRWIRIEDVETHPSQRGRGIAGALLATALADGARTRPGAPAFLEAAPDGVAERVYRRAGFRRIGSRHTVARPAAGLS